MEAPVPATIVATTAASTEFAQMTPEIAPATRSQPSIESANGSKDAGSQPATISATAPRRERQRKMDKPKDAAPPAQVPVDPLSTFAHPVLYQPPKDRSIALAPLTPTSAARLNSLLAHLDRALTLTPQGWKDREALLKRLNAILARAFPQSGLVVEPFGSYAMGISTPSGDVDLKLSGWTDLRLHKIKHWTHDELNGEPRHVGDPPETVVEVSNLPRARTLDVLQDAFAALRKAGVFRNTQQSRPQVIFRARVPIFTFCDNVTGIECDVSCNSDGILKSHVMGRVLRIDPRVASLVRLVKAFAKEYAINDASRGTLKSWALLLMCVTYCQTLPEGPLLPSLEFLLGDPSERPLRKGGRIMSTEEVQGHLAVVEQRVQLWQARPGPRNPVTIGELVQGFLTLAYNKTFCLSVRPGALVGFDPYKGQLLQLQDTLNVQDPFVVAENCSANISPRTMGTWRKVCNAFESAARALNSWSRAMAQSPHLDVDPEEALRLDPSVLPPVVRTVATVWGRKPFEEAGLLPTPAQIIRKLQQQQQQQQLKIQQSQQTTASLRPIGPSVAPVNGVVRLSGPPASAPAPHQAKLQGAQVVQVADVKVRPRHPDAQVEKAEASGGRQGGTTGEAVKAGAKSPPPAQQKQQQQQQNGAVEEEEAGDGGDASEDEPEVEEGGWTPLKVLRKISKLIVRQGGAVTLEEANLFYSKRLGLPPQFTRLYDLSGVLQYARPGERGCNVKVVEDEGRTFVISPGTIYPETRTPTDNLAISLYRHVRQHLQLDPAVSPKSLQGKTLGEIEEALRAKFRSWPSDLVPLTRVLGRGQRDELYFTVDGESDAAGPSTSGAGESGGNPQAEGARGRRPISELAGLDVSERRAARIFTSRRTKEPRSRGKPNGKAAAGHASSTAHSKETAERA